VESLTLSSTSSCPPLDTCTNLGPVLPTVILLYCTSFSLHQYDITVCYAKFEENSRGAETAQPCLPTGGGHHTGGCRLERPWAEEEGARSALNEAEASNQGVWASRRRRKMRLAGNLHGGAEWIVGRGQALGVISSLGPSATSATRNRRRRKLLAGGTGCVGRPLGMWCSIRSCRRRGLAGG
jgi:hypothetical protein